MSSFMRQFPLRWLPAALALCTGMAAFAPGALAAPDEAINHTVWRMYYGATQSQASSAAWLAEDTDGDGFTNADELAAGTNPFKSTSAMGVQNMVCGATHVQITVETVRGKLYVLQYATSLGGTWLALNPSVQGIGDGTPLVLTAPRSTESTYYRVLVQDLDSDNDQVSDWAERVVGFDPHNAHTKNSPLADHAALEEELEAQNVITITATEPLATQPPDFATPATDTATFTVKRGGTLHFGTITIPLDLTGTAVEGVDFAPLPNSVTLTERVGAFNLLVTPMANTARHTTATVTLKVQPGGGYEVGAPTSGSAMIQPAGAATGTGLSVQFFNIVAPQGTSLSDYSNVYGEHLFNPAWLAATRVDPLLNYNWPSSISPATGVNLTYYTGRWTGQIQPQYTERYFIELRTDDGCKLWINDQLLVDRWGSNDATRRAAIDLKAGVRYNIRLDYLQRTGNGRVNLYWYSGSQTRQFIPTDRMYPSSGELAPPSIISPATAVAFQNQPFSFQVRSSNASTVPTTYTLGAGSDPLPPGLSMNTAGLISGTATQAGDFQVALEARVGGAVSAASVLKITVFPPGSGVTREIWSAGVAGSSLRGVPFDTVAGAPAPDLVQLEHDTEYPDNEAVRLRGYVTAPVRGNYYFWLAANHEAELWIANDDEEVTKVKRAWVTAPGTESRQWNAQPNQRTPWLALQAGQKYYYEVRHHRGTGAAPENLAVGWHMDPTGSSAPLADGGGEGLIPAYLLSKYAPPPAVAPTGTLFATNMAPQGSALSKAVGNASLRLSEDKTQAILYFQFSGLTSPKTGYHVHTDAYGTHPAGEIVYDIDDIDRFHSELRTADGGYIWNIQAAGTQTAEDIAYAIENGLAYINIHSVNYPAGEIRGSFSRVVGSQTAPLLTPSPSYPDDHDTVAGAARFLSQAAFGAHPEDLAAIMDNGFEAWIEDQLALPPTYLRPDVEKRAAPEYSARFKSTQFYNAWWKTAVTADDQLRQRMAFALSEILVISFVGGAIDDNSHGRLVAVYYDHLLNHAFGNFRDLLEEITLSPAMGRYLDMRANRAGDLTIGRTPNENYAREIMQLFSFGLNRLWPDGTLVLDSQGSVIPCYNQDVVNGMARVFTGWNYAQPLQENGRLPTGTNPAYNELDRMVLVPSRHELGEKEIFDNVVLPAATGHDPPNEVAPGSQADSATPAFDDYGLEDLEKALDFIHHHESTGPYICRQLIQRLVTSAPSPQYVHRVTAVFNDDGSPQHLRGNLGAVVKAILLDGEARDTASAHNSDTFGKQREPLMRVTGPARTFPTPSITGTFVQNDTPYLTVTTDEGVPHKLVSGNAVYLDFTGNVEGDPPAPPADAPSSVSYTVYGNPPSSTTFNVIPGGQTYSAYTQSAGSNTVTITTSGTVGRRVYLKFPAGGPVSGVYQITATLSSPTRYQVQTTGEAPGSTLTGNVLSAVTPTNTVVTRADSVTTMRFRTTHPSYLVAGDQFWMDFSGTTTATRTDQVFTVSTVESLTDFTVVTPVNVTTGTTNDTIYPHKIPDFNRSGAVLINGSKFDPSGTNNELAQSPMAAPTVFNFFAPEYMYPGSLAANGLTSPEFQITTDTTIINLTNAVTNMILSSGNTNGLTSFRSGGNSVTLDLGPYMAAPWSVANTAGATALTDHLDDLLTGGALSDTARDRIVTFVMNTTYFPNSSSTQVRDRVRAIVQLILTSPEYATQR